MLIFFSLFEKRLPTSLKIDMKHYVSREIINLVLGLICSSNYISMCSGKREEAKE